MPDDQYSDASPYGATFLVEIDGKHAGQFTQVSGLEVSIEVEEVTEGGQNEYLHKLPGRMSWPNIRLERGVTQNDVLFQWLTKSSGNGFARQKNKLERSTVAITMTGLQGKRLRTWELREAFPVCWVGPQFASTSNDQLVEELEITHHGFEARNVK